MHIKMIIDFIRSSIFNVLFYALTAIACIACLPTLILPRRYFMGVVHAFVHSIYFLERYVLGLKLEVRGAENLPESGAYILAAKHQSAYETFKLHLLFKDPAVILKRELLRIPLWGLYLKKSDPIAINRKDPKGATHSIQEGAKRVAAQKRPIVIFPQGTRVSTEQTSSDRPYKFGVAKVQEATQLPIIPLAINAGIFWPKHKWTKRSGRVIFSFLPAIEAGKTREALLQELEENIETESLSLMNEAREDLGMRTPSWAILILTLLLPVLLFGMYSYVWFEVAERTKTEYVTMLSNMSDGQGSFNPPHITGYPGKMHISVEEETVRTDKGRIEIKDLQVKAWPLPLIPADIRTGEISLHYFRWKAPLVFNSLDGRVSFDHTMLYILESTLRKDNFSANLTGELEIQPQDAPQIDLLLSLARPLPLVQALSQSGALKPEMALALGAGLSAFADENGVTRIPVYQKDLKLFVGPMPAMTFDPPRARNSEPDDRLLQAP